MSQQKKHSLTKSTYMRGLSCVKSLYLDRYSPDLRDEGILASSSERFRVGREVGEAAHRLFPGGVLVVDKTEYKNRDAAIRTRRLIDEGADTLFEAVFEHDGVLVSVDILSRDGKSGAFRIYEVKSSTEVKEEYYDDVAVQYYVVKGSGIDVDDVFVVHLNNTYIRQGELDFQELFTMESVRDVILDKQDEVRDNIRYFISILEGKRTPPVDIGEYCDDIYKCEFYNHCWAEIPDLSVFTLSRMKWADRFALYYRGVVHLENLPEDYPLNNRQLIQVQCCRGKRDFIDREAISDFLDTLSYPMYFLDFETFGPAIPMFDNSRPYQMIPFQYSLHYRETRKDKPHYTDSLAEPGDDPRTEFVERLLEDTKEPGDILVYNRAFEKRILNELARDFPEYADAIEERIGRIKDLMEPFSKTMYYKNEMMGSASLKYVLPAVVPDLNYDHLEIADGMAAMAAYEHLWQTTDQTEAMKIRQDLRKYCEMDTYAMVRILEKLERI